MGVQWGVDRRSDWLLASLKVRRGAGRGGVSAGRGGGVEVGGSGAMTRELGGKAGRKGGCGSRERWEAALGPGSVAGPGLGAML